MGRAAASPTGCGPGEAGDGRGSVGAVFCDLREVAQVFVLAAPGVEPGGNGVGATDGAAGEGLADGGAGFVIAAGRLGAAGGSSPPELVGATGDLADGGEDGCSAGERCGSEGNGAAGEAIHLVMTRTLNVALLGRLDPSVV